MPIYKLHPAAEKDLEDIWHYTVEEWGIEQANHYIDDMDNTFQLLAEAPLICRECHEYTPPVRIHHYNHHLIVYLQSNDGISIVRVLHEGMDVEDRLGGSLDIM